jgi:hypothetical protein
MPAQACDRIERRRPVAIALPDFLQGGPDDAALAHALTGAVIKELAQNIRIALVDSPAMSALSLSTRRRIFRRGAGSVPKRSSPDSCPCALDGSAPAFACGTLFRSGRRPGKCIAPRSLMRRSSPINAGPGQNSLARLCKKSRNFPARAMERVTAALSAVMVH